MAIKANENEIRKDEHDETYGMQKVIAFGITGSNEAVAVQVDANGDPVYS